MTSSNPNTNNSCGSNTTCSRHRCIVCGHNRCRCSYCDPRIPMRNCHSTKNERRKKKARLSRDCCRCRRARKLVRFFDPSRKTGLKLIEYRQQRLRATAALKHQILAALKAKSLPVPTRIIRKPCLGLDYEPKDPDADAGAAPLRVFSCLLPGIDRTKLNLQSMQDQYRLELAVRQLHDSVQRLVLLLSTDQTIDISFLRSVLDTLFYQLAVLTHELYPTLAPNILPGRKTFQLSLRIVRGRTQRAYQKLWVAALRTGVLGGRGRALGGVVLGSEGSQIGAEQRAGMLQTAGALAGELIYWVVLMSTGRTL